MGRRRTVVSLGRGFDTAVAAVLAPGAVAGFSRRTRDLVRGLPVSECVLDIGCGYNSPLAAAGFHPVLVDIDPKRVRICARTGLGLVADAGALPLASASAAAVFSFGLLHHLTDSQARRAIAEMSRVVRPGGLIAILDGVHCESAWRRPLAAAIRALDRGHHMRHEAALTALFDGAAGWHYERVTYSLTGLEGVWCIRSR
jgi:SAM-dependent methyltransferase